LSISKCYIDDFIIDVNTYSTSYEFSIATLDRKLKKLKLSKRRPFPPNMKEYERTLYYHNENRDKFFGYPSTIISSFTLSTILMGDTYNFNKK
jgi:hypothetical protein